MATVEPEEVYNTWRELSIKHSHSSQWWVIMEIYLCHSYAILRSHFENAKGLFMEKCYSHKEYSIL